MWLGEYSLEKRQSLGRVIAGEACQIVSAGWGIGFGNTPPGHTGTFPVAILCDLRRTSHTHLRKAE